MPRKRELTFSVQLQRKNVSKAGMQEGFLGEAKGGANGVEHSSESRQRPSSQHLNLGATGGFVNTSPEGSLSTCACVDRFWQQTRLKYHLHSLAVCPETVSLSETHLDLEMELEADPHKTMRSNI